METAKFARVPFMVEAVQVTPDNMEEIANWTMGEIRTRRPIKERGETEDVFYVKVDVLRPSSERQTRAYNGDWVLLHENGSWKVFSEQAFAKCFVLAEEDMTAAEVAFEKEND